MKRAMVGVVGLVAVAGTAMADDTVRLAPVNSGAMKKIGYYMPNRLELSDDKPATLKKVPDGLEAPLYGVLPIAGAPGLVFHIVVDEPAGKPSRLLVDSNGNGDLTDDDAAEWGGKPQGADSKFTMYNGTAKVDIGEAGAPFVAALGVYRFDPSDPQRAQLKNVLLYYRDYAREGEASIGGKTYRVMLADEGAAGDFSKAVKKVSAGGGEVADGPAPQILIDVNGNGKFDNRGEKFDVTKPFNIAGTTYEIAGLTRSGDAFTIAKSSQAVAEIPTPPDHEVGKTILAFEATTMDGKTLRFPGDYKGKVVMLDFWATWCGPCMAEVPGLVKVYDAYHSKGFEVLGISLDQPDSADKVKKVNTEKGMTWTQVYDGKGWKAQVAQMYAIDSIPATFLVDGDTGVILAKGGQLRGESLEKTIQEALAKKAGK
ncbi:MAG: TlpA family protein disulfide reductase [Phycisphaerales bacterium]|nr:TlpA family protein disulfide reductase [Phycisphaerales bacterium]